MCGGGTEIRTQPRKDGDKQTKEKKRRRGAEQVEVTSTLKGSSTNTHTHTQTHTPFPLHAIYSLPFTCLLPWLISFVVLSAWLFSRVSHTLWHTWLWFRARHAWMDTLGIQHPVTCYRSQLHNNELCHLITQKLHHGKFTVMMFVGEKIVEAKNFWWWGGRRSGMKINVRLHRSNGWLTCHVWINSVNWEHLEHVLLALSCVFVLFPVFICFFLFSFLFAVLYHHNF